MTGPEVRPMVLADAVARSYAGPPPVVALRPVTFQVFAGELVAIVGTSGSGKSTLLSILGLLDRPSGGRLEINGVPVDSADERARTQLRATAIGFVFQSFHLVRHKSVLGNVELPLVRRVRRAVVRQEMAREALANVDMAHRADFYPATLSGGESQRVAIARALVGSPRLVLADEPTGNLDSANAEAVLQLLDRARHQRDDCAVVIVTHDNDIARRADKELRLHDGQLVHER